MLCSGLCGASRFPVFSYLESYKSVLVFFVFNQNRGIFVEHMSLVKVRANQALVSSTFLTPAG